MSTKKVKIIWIQFLEHKLLAIIQARTNSRRFRNKVLFPIYGVPIIQYVVTRVKASKNVKKVIVSSSINKSDDKLIRYLKDKKINFYRGDLQNVALRLYKTAQKNKSKFFIRINGDSPLIDTHLIDKAIKIHNNSKKVYEFVGPICESTDKFVTLKKFQKLKEKDLVAICDVGAYGMSLSSNYNLRPKAVELLIKGRKVKIIKKRQKHTDLI